MGSFINKPHNPLDVCDDYHLNLRRVLSMHKVNEKFVGTYYSHNRNTIADIVRLLLDMNCNPLATGYFSMEPRYPYISGIPENSLTDCLLYNDTNSLGKILDWLIKHGKSINIWYFGHLNDEEFMLQGIENTYARKYLENKLEKFLPKKIDMTLSAGILSEFIKKQIVNEYGNIYWKIAEYIKKCGIDGKHFVDIAKDKNDLQDLITEVSANISKYQLSNISQVIRSHIDEETLNEFEHKVLKFDVSMDQNSLEEFINNNFLWQKIPMRFRKADILAGLHKFDFMNRFQMTEEDSFYLVNLIGKNKEAHCPGNNWGLHTYSETKFIPFETEMDTDDFEKRYRYKKETEERSSSTNFLGMFSTQSTNQYQLETIDDSENKSHKRTWFSAYYYYWECTNPHCNHKIESEQTPAAAMPEIFEIKN